MSIFDMSTSDVYISVDCEASGPYPGRHALLSVGAVVVRKDSRSWKLSETYYAEWAPPPGAEEDPAATGIHGLSWTHLLETGQDARQGALAFAEWVRVQSPKRKPFFVGLNAAFDWAFVTHAFGVANLVDNPFHHASIDLKSVIWGAHGGDWLSGSNRKALERVTGKPTPVFAGHRKHHALDDAQEQALLLQALLELRRLPRLG